MKFKIFFSLSLISLLACHGNLKKTKKDDIDTTSLFCLKIKEDKICIPIQWQIIPQSNSYLYARISTIDSNMYFAIIRYQKHDSSISVLGLMKHTYEELVTSHGVEKVVGYTTKKIDFTNDYCYYSEYFTRIRNIPYITYSLVFDRDSSIYEFALKTDSVNSFSSKEKFNSVVFNSYHNGVVFFSGLNNIKKATLVDLSKIK